MISSQSNLLRDEHIPPRQGFLNPATEMIFTKLSFTYN